MSATVGSRGSENRYEYWFCLFHGKSSSYAPCSALGHPMDLTPGSSLPVQGNDGGVCLVIATAGRTGAESVVRCLAQGLDCRGVAVFVLCLRRGPLLEWLESQRIGHTALCVESKFAINVLPRLRAFFRKHRFAIVHTHGARASFFGGVAAWAAGVPIRIASLHDLSPTCGERSKSAALIERMTYRLFFTTVLR